MSGKFYKIEENVDPFELMKEAKDLSFQMNIDILKFIRREKYDISFEECLEIFKNSKHMHWVFIERNDFIPFYFPNNEKIYNYYEIGGCTLANQEGDIFLFLYLTKENGDKLLHKYKFKEL